MNGIPLEISSTRVLMPGSNSVTFTVRTVTAGYGESGISDPVTVVPVELPVLSAEYVNEGTVRVSWNKPKDIDKYVLGARNGTGRPGVHGKS